VLGREEKDSTGCKKDDMTTGGGNLKGRKAGRERVDPLQAAQKYRERLTNGSRAGKENGCRKRKTEKNVPNVKTEINSKLARSKIHSERT